MSSEGKIVLSYHDTLLRESDVSLLKGPHWLNDIVLSFWFEYLEYDLFSAQAEDIAFVSPQVSQFLKLCGSDEASVMLDPLDLVSKKLVLLPVNDNQSEDQMGGSHWSLLAFTPSEGFVHYDSSNGCNKSHALSMADTVGSHLKWVMSRHPLKAGQCPNQENGYDCGIHVICNAEKICEKLISQRVHSIPIKLITDPKLKRKHILETIHELKK